jgi:hypothetical protein
MLEAKLIASGQPLSRAKTATSDTGARAMLCAACASDVYAWLVQITMQDDTISDA